jgi:hypothetical protein
MRGMRRRKERRMADVSVAVARRSDVQLRAGWGQAHTYVAANMQVRRLRQARERYGGAHL